MSQPPSTRPQPKLGSAAPEPYERRWLVLAVLCLSLVLVVAAVSSVNIAIPSIRLQLRPTDTQLLWIVDIYAVVFAGLLLPAGALGDKFGRRGALQLGLAVFALGSVLSSQASSPNALLVFRCLMGVGAAFIMPSTLSLLTSVFPAAERPRAIAIWTGFAGAGGVIGTLASGLLLTNFWWGSVFFVAVPIALIALVAVTVLCPSSKEAQASPLDPRGALLSIVGFGSLLYGIIEGPERGWTSATTIGAFVASVSGFVGFVLWEKRCQHPMLDVNFFKIKRFAASSLGVTFTFMAMFSMFFVIAQFLQSVRGYSPLRSGFATLPFAVTMVAISPRGPVLAAKFGARRLVAAGLLVMPVGLLMLSLLGTSSPYVMIAAALVLMALGPALAMPTMSTAIVLSLPMDKAGVGSAVNDTTREVGGAVGIAVFGSILGSVYRSGIASALAALPPEASQVKDAARRGVGPLGGLVQAAPGVPELRGQLPQLQELLTVARSEFVHGMHVGLRVMAAIVLLVAIAVIAWFPDGELRSATR